MTTTHSTRTGWIRAAGICFLVIAACTMNPATGQRQLTLLSEAQEIQIGVQTHPEVLATYGAYDDPRQGYTIGRTYYHPVLAFKVDFPDQWRIINQRQALGALSENRDAAVVLTLSEKESPRAAFDAFFAQQGIKKGPNRGRNIFAFRSYDTQTGVREAEGVVRFISQGGRVYQLLGYTGVDTWKTYGASMQQSLGSFAKVTDRRYLNVKPKTIDVVELPQDMTLAEFAARYPSTAETSELAIINGVNEDTVLEKGRLVKRVVGGKLPEG